MVRTFKRLSSAQDLARMNGWAIATRKSSACGNYIIVRFEPKPPQSTFMAGLV